MIPTSFTRRAHRSPMAVCSYIKSRGQRVLAETTSYFALAVVLSSFLRLLQVPTAYEQALIPLVTKYQMYIQSFHVLVGFHTRVKHKDSDGVRTTISGKGPSAAMPHNSSLMLHTFFLIVAVFLQIGIELIIFGGIGPGLKWVPLNRLVYLCDSSGNELRWAAYNWRNLLGTGYLWYLDPLWYFDYFIPPTWVIIHVVWFRRCGIVRFPVVQPTDNTNSRHNDCHSGVRSRHSTKRPTSAGGKSVTASGRYQNPLRPCLLVLSVHVIILFFGYTIACIWMASIKYLPRCFGRPTHPPTKQLVQPVEPAKQWVFVRFLHFTLWGWVTYDMIRMFTNILVTRESISDRTGGLDEWGIGQVAAMMAWLPMVVQFVGLFWSGVSGKY